VNLRELRYGRLVWARVVDRNGVPKERPCVIVTPTARIRGEEPLLVVAVTTTFPEPAPRWHVELPWNPDPRRVRTRLARRSAAVVNWLDTIGVDDVLDVKGDVPAEAMRRIEALVAECTGEGVGG
jgi:mRNA-degrading endonuclease toxin of MazEF toxin-antitoxin module